MVVNYGAALKPFLCNRVTLIRVHRFNPDDLQFGDAFVSSAILLFRKTPPVPEHTVQFTFGGTIAKPQAREAIPLDSLRASRKWTTYPKDPRNDQRTCTDGNGPVLADFFRIQRGIATGCNKFFVLERTDAARRRLPKPYLHPILPSPRNLKTTIIEADA
jgi:adenine-specific DNA-methyltransferase